MPGSRPALLYMATVRDAIARGDIDEMRGLAKTVNAVIKGAGDAESEEIKELKTSQVELLAALAERSSVTLARKDIVAIHEGMVLIDSIELARSLKTLLETDAEPSITVIVKW